MGPRLMDSKKSNGNTFFTSLIFLFVLIGTLRLCCNKTLHENKLSSIFIQETQGFYLLENLMALTRDYAYQIVQNPKEPNIFLSVDAYQKKDKSYNPNNYVIDFKGSLSEQQIVPNDFPLSVDWTQTAIYGGPIFWQSKNKSSTDERYLADVFMLGNLRIKSEFVPDWDMHMVQTMEIERNPLCDFQLYSEGDTSLGGNISSKSKNWYINFQGPIQINGNARFPKYQGYENNNIYFKNVVHIAGFGLKINEKSASCSSIALPSKYCMYDNSTFYNNYTNPYSQGKTTYSFNTANASYINLDNYLSNSGSSTQRYNSYNLFNTSQGKCLTRSRILRPCGFDPISDWGYWLPNDTTNGLGGTSENARMVEFCFGLHNLCKTSAETSHYKYTTNKPTEAMQALRNLSSAQMTEKARLVETQKVINGPGLEIHVYLKKTNDDEVKNLSNIINIPYTTYNNTTYFSAIRDNFYLNRYLNIRFKNCSIISNIRCYQHKSQNNILYSWPNDTNPTSTFNIQSNNYYQRITDNKLSIERMSNRIAYNDALTAIKTKSAYTPNGWDDTTCPPHKLIDCGDHWEFDPIMTRLKTDENYQFIYDKNRAKWIQIIDIDIGSLNNTISNWNDFNHTVKINCAWLGKDINGNRNYKHYQSDKINDIRQNYITDRENFFNTYPQEGDYVYTKDPVVDIGVRLINAETLPEGGLTFLCPYPLYIKGNYNTKNSQPALIITDSLTLLSDDWLDWQCEFNDLYSYLFSPDSKSRISGRTATEIHANIMTGRTHPNYWLTKDKNLNPDNGFHDAIRSLEDFSTPVKIYGSLLLPYYCQQQWEPPINFCHKKRPPSTYAPANLYLTHTPNDPTPGMPFYYKINRGRKTQTIGNINYNALKEIHDFKDCDVTTYTLSTYHNQLPNYLKYETTPQ